MLIDTHCHLSSGKFKQDLGEVIKKALNSGVEKIIMPATNLKDARRIVELAEKYDCLYGVVGIYPGEAQKKDGWEKDLEEIKKLLKKEKIAGVGEIGLDTYWNKRGLELDREVFGAQLKMAVEMEMPVVIHNREAEKEIREVFEGMEKLPAGQFHCWSGSEEFLGYVLEKGFYVGFCGNVTYPSNNELREMAKRVPLDRLLLETDSPYLAPQGKRGERNEPINVKIIAEVLAEVKGISLNELIKQTGQNARELYRLN